MKKIIYLLLFAFASSISFTSCTEEEIKPKNELTGAEQDPFRPSKRK